MGTRVSILLLVACALLSSVLCNVRRKRIIGGREAALPPEDDPVVIILKEDHDATVYGLREKRGGFYSFRGIRYAEPPVDKFRFQRSRRMRLEGEINATSNAAPCPQMNSDGGGVIGKEDCLFLNVYSAELPGGGDGLPVVVWIHGGGFRRGSASQYGARHLVDKKVVVVTIQYRLGSLGFLSTGLIESPGNVAMFDMTLALGWIKEYISFFGGNPNKVTISGQDTGASAAIMLSLSSETKGFIGGVIAMSGSALSSFAVDSDPTRTCKDLARDNGCPTSPVLDMVRCLQQLPIEKIIAADSALQATRMEDQGIVAGLGGLLSAAPVVDGEADKRFLPTFMVKTPLDLLNSGMMPSVPLLTGVTKDQTSTALLGGLRGEVENRIKSIPGFFNSVVGNLMNNSVTSVLKRPLELTAAISTTYFNLLPLGGGKGEDIQGAVKKIVEASGDALFNLPAFQTARLWGQKAPAYFYSFDYEGKKKAGPQFLKDSPLTQFGGGEQASTGVGHGDDLLFMFESFSVDGNTRHESLELDDAQDIKVRDTFSKMISEFAWNGQPQVPSDDPKERKPWPTFGGSGFVSITDKPTVGKDFRFCEMGLWAGLGDRLQSVTCQALEGVKQLSSAVLGSLGVENVIGVNPVEGVEKVLGNVPLGDTGKVLDPVTNVGGSVLSPLSNGSGKPLDPLSGGSGNLLGNVNSAPKVVGKGETSGKVDSKPSGGLGNVLGGGSNQTPSRTNNPRGNVPARNSGGGGVLGGGGGLGLGFGG